MVSGPQTFFKQWIYGKVNSPSVFGSVSPGLRLPYLLFSLSSICKRHLHRASWHCLREGSPFSLVTPWAALTFLLVVLYAEDMASTSAN